MKNFIQILVGTLTCTLLLACGSGSKSSGDASSNSDEPIQKQSSKVLTPNSVNPSIYSFAFDDKSEMPLCDSSHDHQLCYIKNESKFYNCTANQWSEVSIKGEKGDRGDPGVAGSNGKAGSVGDTGAKGKDGQMVNSNMWYDPISKKYWLIPSVELDPSMTNFLNGCGNPSDSEWRVPSFPELDVAVGRGLRNAADAISAPRESWVTPGQVGGSVNIGSGITISEQYVRTSNVLNNLAGYYCIQK